LTSFNYTARDRYGVLAAGHLEGQTERAVAIQLEKMGFTPISIAPAEVVGIYPQIEQWLANFQKVNPEEMVVFTRQLNSILEAGVPLITGLDAISEQLRNTTFRLSVQRVKREIEGGSTFSDALERQKKIYSPLIINMVRAGEKAGILPNVLDRISNLLEYDIKTADRIKSATRYPLIVLYTMIGGVLALNLWVLPRFAAFFSSFKMELPLPTKILMGTNYVITTYWYWFIGLFILGGYLIRKVMETEAGRYNYDRFILQVPGLGQLFQKIYLSRFGRMLAAMLGSGIPILEALTITSNTVDNKVIARVIIGIRDDVFQGQTLAVPMRGSGLFPPISVSMVAIGEKVGMLENMLNKMADYFDREVDYTIANLTPLLEPLMIFGLGLLLLVFALGVFLPMWNVVNIYKTF